MENVTFIDLFTAFQAALIAYSVGGLERVVLFKIELEGLLLCQNNKNSSLGNKDSSKHIK